MITLSCNTVCYLSLYYASLRSGHKWISFISVINKPKKEKKRKNSEIGTSSVRFRCRFTWSRNGVLRNFGMFSLTRRRFWGRKASSALCVHSTSSAETPFLGEQLTELTKAVCVKREGRLRVNLIKHFNL